MVDRGGIPYSRQTNDLAMANLAFSSMEACRVPHYLANLTSARKLYAMTDDERLIALYLRWLALSASNDRARGAYIFSAEQVESGGYRRELKGLGDA